MYPHKKKITLFNKIMEILAKLQEYKTYILIALYSIIAIFLILNFGFILEIIGFYVVLKFAYENLIFVEDRKNLIEKINIIIKEVNG